MKPEREKRLLGNRGKEKQLTLKLDKRSSDRLPRIVSEQSSFIYCIAGNFRGRNFHGSVRSNHFAEKHFAEC